MSASERGVQGSNSSESGVSPDLVGAELVLGCGLGGSCVGSADPVSLFEHPQRISDRSAPMPMEEMVDILGIRYFSFSGSARFHARAPGNSPRRGRVLFLRLPGCFAIFR